MMYDNKTPAENIVFFRANGDFQVISSGNPALFIPGKSAAHAVGMKKSELTFLCDALSGVQAAIVAVRGQSGTFIICMDGILSCNLAVALYIDDDSPEVNTTALICGICTFPGFTCILSPECAHIK